MQSPRTCHTPRDCFDHIDKPDSVQAAWQAASVIRRDEMRSHSGYQSTLVPSGPSTSTVIQDRYARLRRPPSNAVSASSRAALHCFVLLAGFAYALCRHQRFHHRVGVPRGHISVPTCGLAWAKQSRWFSRYPYLNHCQHLFQPRLSIGIAPSSVGTSNVLVPPSTRKLPVRASSK